MGVLEACGMVMRGWFDVFDHAIAVIEYVEKLLAEQDIPVELHPGMETYDGGAEIKAHFFDRKGEMQADLKRAKEMVSDACQIAQNTIGEM